MSYNDGDYFYGLDAARNNLARALTRDRHGFTGLDPKALRQPLTVDELKPGSAKESYFPDPSSTDVAKRLKVVRKAVSGKLGNPISASHSDYAMAKLKWEDRLKDVLNGHTRYNDTFALLGPSGADRFLGFAHKCKAGLVAVFDENRQIHYALDGINMDTVVAKIGDRGKSITASELRWLFRNRANDKSRLQVHFYLKNVEVQAPWVTDSATWTKYVQKAYRNFKGEVFLPDSESFRKSVERPFPHKRPKLLKNIMTGLDDYHDRKWDADGVDGRCTALENIDDLCTAALVSKKVNSARHPGVRVLQTKVKEEIVRVRKDR